MKESAWARQFVAPEGTYEPRFDRPGRSPSGTERAELAAFVLESQRKARVDAKRFATLAVRSGFWAVVSFVVSWWFGAIFWLLAVGLGAYALWMFGRAIAERRVSEIGSEP